MSDWLTPEMRAALTACTEVQRVAIVLAGEARSEPIEGQVAVANVIRNRVAAKTWFGKTFSEVVLKPWQFSCLHEQGGKGNYRQVLKFAQQMAQKVPITEPKLRQCVLVAHGICEGYLTDNVKGATHYHTVALMPRPAWAQSVVPVCQKGGHLFYVGVK